MRISRASFVLLTACLFGAPARAHEGGMHSRGTVKEIAPGRLVLATTEGAEVRVMLAPGTRVIRGKRAVPVTDIHRGERAVVHAARQHGNLEATEIRLAEDPK